MPNENILSNTAGIVDTGTTLIMIATGESVLEAFEPSLTCHASQRHSMRTSLRLVPSRTSRLACSA